MKTLKQLIIEYGNYRAEAGMRKQEWEEITRYGENPGYVSHKESLYLASEKKASVILDRIEKLLGCGGTKET